MAFRPPKVAHEERGANYAIIWYSTDGHPVVSGSGDDGRQLGELRQPTVMRIGLAVPSWGRPCGVAEYTHGLQWGFQQLGLPAAVLGEAARIAQAASQNRCNVVHIQHEYSLWEPGLLRRQALELLRHGVRPVVTVHAYGAVPDHNAVLRDVFPCLVVHAEGMAHSLRSDLGIPAERVRVIRPGVRPYQLPDRNRVRAELGLAPGQVALGYCGFFYPQKGLVELGEAVAELRGQFPDLRCFLFANVADNDTSRRYYEQVRAAFSARGLWESVTLRNEFLPEGQLVGYLHAMDLNVFPYADLPAQQVSAAVRSAIAALRPIITTRAFAFADLEGEVEKIPDNHPGRIADAVRGLQGDPGRQEALIAAMRQHIGQQSWSAVASRHLALYAGLRGDRS